MALNAATRRRLDIQGLEAVDDAWLAEVGPWLGLAFGLCATLAAVGTAAASVGTLWVLVSIATLAVVSPVHPFDLVYNWGIRHLRGTRSLPLRGAPTRFACGMGAVWLLATIWAFSSGQMTLGYLLGAALTGVALLVATTNICIPSMVYQAVLGGVEPRPPAAPR